jgi:transcriptional regulator with XRE-family HTH domain
MPALGERFRAAREARGLSLSDVAEQIRIRSVYLAAIEDDNWNAIGAPVYVRGFLRTYARFLGLDPARGRAAPTTHGKRANGSPGSGSRRRQFVRYLDRGRRRRLAHCLRRLPSVDAARPDAGNRSRSECSAQSGCLGHGCGRAFAHPDPSRPARGGRRPEVVCLGSLSPVVAQGHH